MPGFASLTTSGGPIELRSQEDSVPAEQEDPEPEEIPLTPDDHDWIKRAAQALDTTIEQPEKPDSDNDPMALEASLKSMLAEDKAKPRRKRMKFLWIRHTKSV